MTPTYGIYDLTAAEYHSDPCPQPSLSSSIAKTLIDQSPLHAWHQHPRLNPKFEPEQDSRFDLGSAAHMVLLERRSDGIAIVVADDWRTKAAREQRDAARAEGKFPILERHYSLVDSMVRVAIQFLETTELAGILELGFAERAVVWQENDVWCRCRPDLLSEDHRIVLDYKTTECASHESFTRQIGRMGYDLQAEFYVRGINATTGIEPTFVFLAQEITPPFACSLVALSNAYRAVGQSKVARALALWEQCTKTNAWPAYSARIAYAEPAPWQMIEMDEPRNSEQESEP